MAKPRIRVDRLLADRGLAASREVAQALIRAGKILVDGQTVEKCGAPVSAAACITVIGSVSPYVSRAGTKLAGALDHFGIDPRGMTCLDIGASTGGFTQCLLDRGAAKVYAIDTGTNQLASKLRYDSRVVVMEKTNARYLYAEDLPERRAGDDGCIVYLGHHHRSRDSASLAGGRGCAGAGEASV